jgi:hypothetical protein
LSFGAALLVRETGIVLILALAGRRSGMEAVDRRRGGRAAAGCGVAAVCGVGSQRLGWATIATNPGDLGVRLQARSFVEGRSRRDAAFAGIAAALMLPILLAAA